MSEEKSNAVEKLRYTLQHPVDCVALVAHLLVELVDVLLRLRFVEISSATGTAQSLVLQMHQDEFLILLRPSHELAWPDSQRNARGDL